MVRSSVTSDNESIGANATNPECDRYGAEQQTRLTDFAQPCALAAKSRVILCRDGTNVNVWPAARMAGSSAALSAACAATKEKARRERRALLVRARSISNRL
jgi:hypothetical protein